VKRFGSCGGKTISSRATSASPAAGTTTANQYRTVHYWLIPAVPLPVMSNGRRFSIRGNAEVNWQGKPIPIALAPHGVTQNYAPWRGDRGSHRRHGRPRMPCLVNVFTAAMPDKSNG
jgi:hypothetical protein